mmetsp:Transcript_104107/g.238385  ORF Transcript_104107/g.238385 Transcript_104107/m.238385 type:complete len:334 (+) Transcript_104107:1834-2835(+)
MLSFMSSILSGCTLRLITALRPSDTSLISVAASSGDTSKPTTALRSASTASFFFSAKLCCTIWRLSSIAPACSARAKISWAFTKFPLTMWVCTAVRSFSLSCLRASTVAANSTSGLIPRVCPQARATTRILFFLMHAFPISKSPRYPASTLASTFSNCCRHQLTNAQEIRHFIIAKGTMTSQPSWSHCAPSTRMERSLSAASMPSGKVMYRVAVTASRQARPVSLRFSTIIVTRVRQRRRTSTGFLVKTCHSWRTSCPKILPHFSSPPKISCRACIRRAITGGARHPSPNTCRVAWYSRVAAPTCLFPCSMSTCKVSDASSCISSPSLSYRCP